MFTFWKSRNDVDGALSKYSQIANAEPEIAELWNNIGLCFFKKQKFIVVCFGIPINGGIN